MNVDELRNKMREAHEAAEAIVNKADGETRALTEPEQKRLDELLVEFDTHKRQLESRGKLDAATATMAQSQGRAVAPFTPGRGGPDPRTLAPYDQKADLDNLDDFGFRNLGEQLCAIRGIREGRMDKRLQTRAQGEASGVGGGFLCAPRFEAETMMRVKKPQPFIGMINEVILPGYGETASVTYPALGDNNRSANELAGFKTITTAENVELTEDTIDLESRTLSLTKQAKLIKVSNELMSDSAIRFGDVISEVMAAYIGLRFSSAIISGTGAGEPLGVMNAPDKVSQTTSTTAGNLLTADIAGMMSKLEIGGLRPGFVAHPTVLQALTKLRPTATAGEPITWASDAGAGLPLGVYGYPFMLSDACKQMNTVGDLILGNWDQYLMVRTQLFIENSADAGFSADQTWFRIRWRWAGGPKNSGTLLDRQSFVAASFVTLATRS